MLAGGRSSSRRCATGAHRRELAALSGPGRILAAAIAGRGRRTRRAPRRSRAKLPKVYLLPGIMGSQLGYRRSHGQPPDLLWLDPSDIMHGRLAELRRGARPLAYEPLGGIAYSYLALKLRLQARGFEVVLHDYDWRAGPAARSARALAARLRADARPRWR